MTIKSYSRYRNINTVIHSIDPITKFIAFIFLIIATFISQTIPSLTLVFLFVLFVSLLANIKIKSYINVFLFIIPFFIIMFFLYWLAYQDPTKASISVAFMSERLYMFLLIAIIYTSTTKEMDIASSIEWFINPLKFIKVPTYEISMMIMLAIRFIPLMLEDLRMITIAQTSRGVNVYNGNFKTKIKGTFNSLLPMFVLAFKRSNDVANAMIIRGYKIGKPRTKYKKNKFGFLEFITLLLMIILIVIVSLMAKGII